MVNGFLKLCINLMLYCLELEICILAVFIATHKTARVNAIKLSA